MAEAPQQPARYARLCTEAWEERDAWLLSFLMGDGFELTGHEPAPTNCRARRNGVSHQPAPRWAAVSPTPFTPASRHRLSVSSLPSLPHALHWRCRQIPPLHKAQLVSYSSITPWDRGSIKKNPGAARDQKLK